MARRQPTHDLDHARRLRVAGDHDWAMLAAQQAAEKASKAILLAADLRADASRNLGGLFDALVAAGVADRSVRARLTASLNLLTLAFGFARCPDADIGEARADLIGADQSAAALEAADALLAAAQAMAPELG